jgi:hypothetical protein
VRVAIPENQYFPTPKSAFVQGEQMSKLSNRGRRGGIFFDKFVINAWRSEGKKPLPKVGGGLRNQGPV